MKVISSSEMSRIERLACQEGFSDSVFMQTAGENIAAIVRAYVEEHHQAKVVTLLCGKGNNAGDAYVAGKCLLKMGYSVKAIQIVPIEECSTLCKKNQHAFVEQGGTLLRERKFPHQGVILDGIFGTGFHGTIEEPYLSFVKMANCSGLPIIAVDIPSGINGDTGDIKGEVIKADLTIFLQLPKTGFFLGDAWNHVGNLECANFGLPEKWCEAAVPDLILIDPNMAHGMLPQMKRNRHKYEAGYVIGIAGSPGMPGAALLSSLAVLRGGAGMVRLLHPQGMETELSASPYEVIKESFQLEHPESLLHSLERAKAVFIGPGIGRSAQVKEMLKFLFPRLKQPCVVDGDALTLGAEENIPFPSGAILTPHIGELMRLLKISTTPRIDLEFLKICQKFVEANQVILVIKGAPSFILHPQQQIHVSTPGDPGMATAGSGDVLTGLIAALLAQGLSTHQAAILGVFLHGIAGELAARSKTSYAMIASDIIQHFSGAYKQFE